MSQVVRKALDVERRKALFVVLSPQEGDETDDLHGSTYSADEIELARDSFNKHCRKANLFHCVELSSEDAVIDQCYINPAEFSMDDGRVIKAGAWLQVWYFPEGEVGDALWNSVKSGEINGVSIYARAKIEKLEA